MSRQPLQTWAARYLDPGSRMTEVLVGLIITLTFTLGAGLVVEEEGRAGARQLLIATASCTLAWGVTDGVFYVLGQLFERGRLRRVWLKVTQATSDGDARAGRLGLGVASYSRVVSPRSCRSSSSTTRTWPCAFLTGCYC